MGINLIKRGGQVAIEFVFLVAVAFAVSIIFLYAILDQTVELNDEKEFVAVQDISYKIHDELIIASSVDSGYTRDFELPQMTHFFDYNMSVLNNTLIVTTKNKEYVFIVPTIQGQPKKGWNRICNINGSILIETGGCVYTP